MLTENHAIFNDKNQDDAQIIADLVFSAEEYYLKKAREAVLSRTKEWLKFKGYEATDELAQEFMTGRL